MNEKRLEELHLIAFQMATSKYWMSRLSHPDELAAVLACMHAMVVEGCCHLPATDHKALTKQLLEYTEANRVRNLAENSN